jgi:serine protease Do
MKRVALIAVLLVFLVGTGLTVAWIGHDSGQLVLQTPVASAQDTGSTTGDEATQTTSLNQSITDSGQSAIKNAIAAVGPAVVRVDVTGTVQVTNPFSDLFNDPFYQRFFGTPNQQRQQQQQTQSVGSGFAILYEGEKLVITNQHVIDSADTITVTDVNGDTWNASVVGSDDVLDVAVLRLEGDTSPLATATLGDSDAVDLGDWAIAIGSPLGLSQTVTMGIISATHRDIEKPSGVGIYNNLIQTDAAINPGNSGGPLVNAAGQVIGINTMIARSTSTGVSVEGINFAISINGITDFLPALIQEGSIQRGWLGVQHTAITEASAETYGIDPNQTGTLVVYVFPGDPADVAGMQEGDVIVQVGDTPITSSDDLNTAIGTLAAGTTVDIGIIRDGQPMTLSVTLGLRPSEAELASYQGTSQQNSDAFRGITVGAISTIIAQQLGLNSTDGVVIMNVQQGSRAEQAGLAEGDVVLEINHQEVTSVDDWNTTVSELSDSSAVTLTVFRNGGIGFIVVE